MVGLGHLRRNLLLARQFAGGHDGTAVLMLTEAREACAFEFPPGVDCVSLPALRKDPDNRCVPRYLPIGLEDVVRARARILEAAILSFEPDVLIVDHLPRGALGELEPTLEALRRRGETQCVLGLRDVLEEPETVAREWARHRNEEAIAAFYDRVWIYGDPVVFDALTEYDFGPEVAARARYLGYLDPSMAHPAAAESVELLAEQAVDDRRLVLCQVGGGQDGMRLAESFVAAELPSDTHRLLLTGPFMPPAVREGLRNRARFTPHLDVLDFIPEPLVLLRRAARVVTMGGYNSVAETLAFGKRALVVPRTTPRCEQRIRAERLAGLGVIDMALPEDVTAESLEAWIETSPDEAGAPVAVDRMGLHRASEQLGELLRAGSPVSAVA